MRRRDFIKVIAGSAASWPLITRAQQPAMPVVGFLNSASAVAYEHLAQKFRDGLSEVGYVDGRNISIEYRWAEGHYDRLPALAADLVRNQVAVIAAMGTPAGPVAKAATATIPIVFSIGIDPVKAGLVTSFDRPGGNATGVINFGVAAVTKQLELLHKMLPAAVIIAVLMNPNFPTAEEMTRELHEGARTLGLELHVLNASDQSEIDTAFATLAQMRVQGLLVAGDPDFTSRRDQLVALAARYAVPAIYPFREFPAVGGLMSYSSSLADAYHQVGIYTGRILKGEKPANLPVVQATRFELVINLKTAKSLGLTFPPGVLSIADEVIE
jgi:putative tryptophan/tyrosine transport system substrate-binding protein